MEESKKFIAGARIAMICTILMLMYDVIISASYQDYGSTIAFALALIGITVVFYYTNHIETKD